MNALLMIVKRIPAGVAAFTAAYLMLSLVGAVATGNREFLFYIAVMLVLVGIVGLVHLRVGLSRGVLWALSVWGLAHMVGGLAPVPESWPIHGEIRVFYSWWLIPGVLKYDHVVHAYGFGVATFVWWEGLQKILAGFGGEHIRPTVGMVSLCGAASTGLGALNEIVEFVATLLVPETNVGGYINTGWDLVSNLVGAAFAAFFIWLAANHRRQRRNVLNSE